MIEQILRAVGVYLQKYHEPEHEDSIYYHSLANCGVELDVSRRGNVVCSMHPYTTLCHCGWEIGKHYAKM